MNKALILLFGIVIFFACKQENVLPPINPDLPTTGAANFPYVVNVDPGTRGLLADDDLDTAGIQASVVVTFSDFMDEASLSGSVTVMNTTTGDMVPNLSVSYNKEARKLYIHSEGWSSSSSYLLRLVTGGIKNRYGTPLSGYPERVYRGSPYDDYITTFYTNGSEPDSCVAITPPIITTISPDTERIITPQPEMDVEFSTAMDTTNLLEFLGNFKLYEGSPAGTSVVIDTIGFVTPFSIRFRLKNTSDSLINGNKYFFVINSANLKAKYLRNTPEYLFALDADYDGPEPTESNFVWYFLYDTIAPPTVSDVVQITNGLRFDFSARMNESILTLLNIKVFDETGYVPGALVIKNQNTDNTTTSVEYYFERETIGQFRVFVSKSVKSNKNRLLDSNGNGIGGEEKDDYWHNL